MFGTFFGDHFFGPRYFGPGGELLPPPVIGALPNPLTTWTPRRPGRIHAGAITTTARQLYSIDFRRLLRSGETLTGCAVTLFMHDLSAADDEDAQDRIEAQCYLQSGDLIASQWFEPGGVVDGDYVLSFHATYTDGEIQPVQVIVPVRRMLSS